MSKKKPKLYLDLRSCNWLPEHFDLLGSLVLSIRPSRHGENEFDVLGELSGESQEYLSPLSPAFCDFMIEQAPSWKKPELGFGFDRWALPRGAKIGVRA